MVSPLQKKLAVAHAVDRRLCSVRRACTYLNLPHSTYRALILAIRLAAQTASAEDRHAMAARMADLEEAAASGDPSTRCDLALHRSIWQASDNAHLLKILDSVFGAIFIMADRDITQRSRDVALDLQYHRDLIDLVSAGKAGQASQEMDRHLNRSLQNSLKTFQVPEPSSDPAQ